MKIDLTLPLRQLEEERTNIYNILKRSEEDLLRRIPTLKELNVTVNPLPDNTILANKVVAGHNLTEDEEVLTMTVRYHPNFTTANIPKAVSEEMRKIIKIYY